MTTSTSPLLALIFFLASPLMSLAGDPEMENQVVVEYLNAAALRMP